MKKQSQIWISTCCVKTWVQTFYRAFSNHEFKKCLRTCLTNRCDL